MAQLSYWDQLKKLEMYSQERRRERYIIIYVWRILEGQVSNIYRGNNITSSIVARWHCRRGRVCELPQIARQSSPAVKRLREASLIVKGQRLFNALPLDIRNITDCSKEYFKRQLDKYLCNIPDEPQIQGYTAHRRAETNSLVDMIKHKNAYQDQRVEGLDVRGSSGSRGCASSVAMA